MHRHSGNGATKHASAHLVATGQTGPAQACGERHIPCQQWRNYVRHFTSGMGQSACYVLTGTMVSPKLGFSWPCVEQICSRTTGAGLQQ